MRGHIRKDLTGVPVRFWTIPRYSNYAIIYDPATSRWRLSAFSMEPGTSLQLKDE